MIYILYNNITYPNGTTGVSYFVKIGSFCRESSANKNKAKTFKSKKEIANYFGYKTINPILKHYKLLGSKKWVIIILK